MLPAPLAANNSWAPGSNAYILIDHTLNESGNAVFDKKVQILREGQAEQTIVEDSDLAAWTAEGDLLTNSSGVERWDATGQPQPFSVEVPTGPFVPAPAGDVIVIGANDDLRVIDGTGAVVAALGSGRLHPANVAWSADDTHLAVERTISNSDTEIVIWSRESGLRLVAQRSRIGSWSPDNQYFAARVAAPDEIQIVETEADARSTAPGRLFDLRLEQVLINVETGEVMRLPRGSVLWSPDGSRFAVLTSALGAPALMGSWTPRSSLSSTRTARCSGRCGRWEAAG